MNRSGILWKLRFPEQEISIAEEHGPVRTFKCLPVIFEKLRSGAVREGCYIEANFCMEKRMIIEVQRVKLEGFVTKWAPKYAFVHTPIVPQIRLQSNARVADIKFLHNPPNDLASTYLDPAECDFSLENGMAIRFSLLVNLKKTSNLRNSPYCDYKAAYVQKIDAIDLKAIKVEKMKDKSSSRRSSQSSQAVGDDTRLTSWLDRRMSSPRANSRSPGRRTPEGKTPEPKFLDEGMRRRGGSTPVKKHVKRDPSHSNKRKRPPQSTQSAPNGSNVVTPAKDAGTPEPDLKHVINRLQAKSRPQSAKASLEAPPNSSSRCLRCEEDDVKECTHKPPHSRSNKDSAKKSKAHLSLTLQDTDAIAECARLRQEVADLTRRLEKQKQNSHPNVQHYQRQYKTPSLHVSYDQAIENKHYDTIFAHSPSVSPSSSPLPDMFHDPEKFLPFLCDGGIPSSTRSDILMGASTHNYDHRVHHHYGTPFTQEVYFPEADEFFSESRSATSTPTWATNSEQLSARECLDYYEQGKEASPFEYLNHILEDDDMPPRRKSPREITQGLVPPVELDTAAHVHGERRPHPKQHIPRPLVNQDTNLNRADSSRWAPVVSDEDFRFNTPTKRTNHYKLPKSHRNKKSAKPVSSYRW